MNTNFISPTRRKNATISATKTLLVFNPEHDLALAVGHGPYTPPAEIVKIRKQQSLLPALYADNGDFILLRDPVSRENFSSLHYFDICREKELNIVLPEELPDITQSILRILPWGWDHAITKDLRDNGVPENLLPSEDELEVTRNLSHRRTVIPFRKVIAEFLDQPLINLPIEVDSVKKVEKLLEKNAPIYFKAPWSSSGRGIVVSDHISRKGLLEWCHGVIRHQGSVMAENAWKRVFDFATEWVIEDSEAKYMGVSVFETSSRGKYHGNLTLPQNELYSMIKKSAPCFSEETIEAQREAINKIIAPYYNGYLGIDMLADENGNINHCVELNLRMTMGHVALKFEYDDSDCRQRECSHPFI